MKKIFAFILASLMVLSLVPASAFAAVTNCPKTHTVAVCDSLGISYSQIGNPVAPSCTSAGYTLYACDECGEEFVGNFTEKAGHDYQPDPKRLTENVKADCTTKTNGLTYVVCSVCGDKNVDKNGIQQPIEVSWNHKSVHKLVAVAGSGIGCEARSRCSLCGAEGYLNDETGELDPVAAHKWVFVKVVVEPVWENGKGTNGLAKYECTVCKDTKDVDIVANCDCSDKEIIFEAVEATCTTIGSIALYKCYDCAKYYTVDEDGNFRLLTVDDGDDYNEDGVINELDAVREIKHEKAGDAVAVDGCDATYLCKNCEGTFTVKEHDPLKYGQYGYETCASSVITLYKCKVCYEEWYESTPTLNHETVEFTVPATCNAEGYTGLYCKDCGPEKITGTTYGKHYIVVEELVGETEAEAEYVEVVYPVVYYIELKPDGTTHVPAHKITVNGEEVWQTREEFLEERVCTSGDVTKVWVCQYGCSTYGAVAERITTKPGHVYRDYGVIVNSGTSSTNWAPVLYSSISDKTKGAENEKTSTLSIPKNKKWVLRECVVCGTIAKKTESDFPNTHVYVFDTIEAAYEFHGILLKYIYDGDGQKATRIGSEWDTDYSEFKSGARTVTLKTDSTVNDNCTATGVQLYKCGGGCKTTADFYVKVAAGDHVADMTKGWVKEKVATCTKTGTKGYWTCELCGVKFRYADTVSTIGNEYNGYSGNEQEVITSLTINKHGSTLVAVSSDVCTGITVYKCIGTNDDGELCGALFTDETASKTYDAKSDAHAWVYAKGYEGKAATCNADGTIQIRWCKECKTLEFNALYLAANGKTVRVNLATYTHDLELSSDTYTYYVATEPVVRTFKLTADATVATDMTTTQCSSAVAKFEHYAPVEGFTYFEYDEVSGELVEKYFDVEDYMVKMLDWNEADPNGDHTEVSYDRYMCVACDYEYLTNYVPATGGHINADGEILTTECDNGAITDRVCVVCKKTIAIDHVKSDIVPVKANCSTVGYEYWYCLTQGCGYRSVTGELAIDPDVHDLVDYGFEANYAHDGQEYSKCALCGEIVDEPNALPAPNVAGVEITLSTEFDSYMPGSIVNVTVSLESLLGVDVWAARFPVIYDPAVYEYVGILEGSVAAEFSSAYAILTANNISETEVELISGSTDMYYATGNVGAAGVLSVVAQAEEDIYVKGSYNLVTFQFKVIATSVTDDTDTSFTVAATEVKNPSKFGTVHYYEDVVLAWNTIDCPIQVVNEKAKTVKNMYGDGENSVAPVLHTYLDLDGDTFLTLADAKALYALIIDTDAEYSVLADADADGFITIADLNALYQIFTGAKTIDEILNPAEEKVLGPREMRYENGVLVYDSYCDFDFSGKIDQTSEQACMTGREDYKLFWAELGYTIP